MKIIGGQAEMALAVMSGTGTPFIPPLCKEKGVKKQAWEL
jgi:hypothetical protein